MRIVLIMAVALSMSMAKTTMVKDPAHNLIWEDTIHASDEKVTHPEAITYCKALKIENITGWRLPTLTELLTIVDYKRYDPAILQEFNHTDDHAIYWSNTPYISAKNAFWGVNFKDGHTKDAMGNYGRYLRCVKDIK